MAVFCGRGRRIGSRVSEGATGSDDSCERCSLVRRQFSPVQIRSMVVAYMCSGVQRPYRRSRNFYGRELTANYGLGNAPTLVDETPLTSQADVSDRRLQSRIHCEKSWRIMSSVAASSKNAATARCSMTGGPCEDAKSQRELTCCSAHGHFSSSHHPILRYVSSGFLSSHVFYDVYKIIACIIRPSLRRRTAEQLYP